MENTTGTVFQWYVERNGDPQTRRSFTSESLAQEYAAIYDRIADGETTTRIYLAPTIEMVEIAKAVGEEHSLRGVYAVVEEPVIKRVVPRSKGIKWIPMTVVSLLLVMFAVYGYGVTTVPPKTEPPPKTINCSVSGIDLILLKGGTILMGSSEADRKYIIANVTLDRWNTDRVNSETQRIATVKAFYMGSTEVTIRQFRKFVTATRHLTTAEVGDKGGIGRINNRWVYGTEYNFDNLGETRIDDQMPVLNISYLDAIDYCEWLSEQTGHQYRLPTEAEWEYAARAGTTTRWYTGDDMLTASQSGWTAQSSGSEPHPVAQFEPNGFGLYDMVGNAWEWCDDHYNDNRPFRVLKGGCFRATSWLARPAVRAGHRETHTGTTGFRVVREL